MSESLSDAVKSCAPAITAGLVGLIMTVAIMPDASALMEKAGFMSEPWGLSEATRLLLAAASALVPVALVAWCLKAGSGFDRKAWRLSSIVMLATFAASCAYVLKLKHAYIAAVDPNVAQTWNTDIAIAAGFVALNAAALLVLERRIAEIRLASPSATI